MLWRSGEAIGDETRTTRVGLDVEGISDKT